MSALSANRDNTTEPLRIIAPAVPTVRGRRRRRTPHRDKTPTVGQVVSWWLDNHAPTCSAAHDRERRRILAMFVATVGAERELEQVKPMTLLEFLNRPVCPQCFGREHVRQHRRCICARCKVTVPFAHASAWTTRRWLLHIRAPFNAAVRLGAARHNPFAGVSAPVGERGRDLSDEEFSGLLRLATPAFRRVLVFLRYCGCRPGEMRRIEWPNIDWSAAMITLRAHKTRAKTRRPRHIVMSRVLAKLLMWIHRNEPHEQRVFVNQFGHPWTTAALCKNIRSLRRRAGLAHDVKLYGCRHAFATAAIKRGVDIATIGELLGHQQFATTAHYLHCAGKQHLAAAAEVAATGPTRAPALQSTQIAVPIKMPMSSLPPSLVDQAAQILTLLLKKLS